MQNPINAAITERFYEAIKMLIESKKIRGRQTYCTLGGIDKRNFYAQEKNVQLSKLQLFWIEPMIREFGINANWLFTGKGGMFQKKDKKGNTIVEDIK